MVTTINLIALCCFVLIPVTIAGTAPAPANCSRTCSSGRGLEPGSTVNYPFGFSSGCPIQLSCDGDGNFLIGEFPVLSVTADAVTITIPVACDRPFSLIDQLFRPNFAPTSRNAILLNNCTRSASCRLPSTLVNTHFESVCGGSSTMSCYSEELMYNMSGFINLKRLRAIKCQYLLSSISAEEYNGGLQALDVQMIHLGWWLKGECDCSENANCTEVLAPPYGRKGYRCHCRDGFIGDGFSTGGSCRRGSGKKSSTKIVAITVPTVAAVAALLGVLCYWFSCRKRRQQDRERSAEIPLQQHMEGMSVDEEMQYFNLFTIVAATDGFSDANKLGEGGFGPVYKGKLLEGKEIAVKRLSMRSSQGMEEFKNEVVTIVKLQHRNLVRLFGCCIEGEERILVYEYLPNGSLDAFLFDPTKSRELEWTRRAQIVNGIARGLLYLHEDSRLKIIHRDLKASNVLLDDEMQPKISDFGTARIFGGSQIEANTARIVGTYGYMAPEYAMEGLFSVKSDVYSFGILVLEIISGKKGSGFYSTDRPQSLLSYAWQLWEENKGMELVDANLEKSCPINEALRWIHIALLCVQEDLNLRPVMSSVVLMLRSNSNLPQPKPPPSLIGRLWSDQSTSTGVGTGSLSSDVSTTPGSCCEKIQQIRNTQ